MDIEAVNSLIDDYKYLIESYKKENKHLKELQRNMDKQYEKLEHNWNELKEWLEKELVEMNPQKLNIGEFNLQNNDMNMGRYLTIQRIKELMQEIESGKNE